MKHIIKMRHIILLFSVFVTIICSLISPVYGQLQLVPTTIVLDQSGVGSIIIINTSDESREISITSEFRYNVSDDSGRSVQAESFDELKEYDMTDNVLIFPQRFVLDGGARRDVRVQHRVNSSTVEGGHFSRFIVRSEPVAQEVEEDTDADAISIQLNYIFVQDIPMYHFYGNATTGININDVEVLPFEDDSTRYSFVFDMEKLGNSPYRGSADVTILNSQGDIVDQRNLQVGLFTDRKVSISMDKSILEESETYTARFLFQTRRRTSAPSELVQAPDVTFEQDFSLEL